MVTFRTGTSAAPSLPVSSVVLLSRQTSLRLLVNQILAAPGSGGTCSMQTIFSPVLPGSQVVARFQFDEWPRIAAAAKR
jgi:hypothetical protein